MRMERFGEVRCLWLFLVYISQDLECLPFLLDVNIPKVLFHYIVRFHLKPN